MSKIKNKTIHSDDVAWLQRLAEELDFIGRAYRLDTKKKMLVQFALPPQKPKPKRDDKNDKRRSERK